MSKAWIKEVKQQLAHVCNGEITTPGTIRPPWNEAWQWEGIRDDHVECVMKNGVVSARIASDGTRMLIVKKTTGEKNQDVSMESNTDEMVITRSLSGSIEFLHKMGDSPEVRIEQDGKTLGRIKINAYNPKVKTALYAYL